MKIIFIVPYRGIGDLIFHIPIFKFIFKKFNSKIELITNHKNKAKILLKNENYISKITYHDFNREKQIINSIKLLKKINQSYPDILFLTHGSKRLFFPLFLAKSKDKKFFERSKNSDLAKFLINQIKKFFPKEKISKDYAFNFKKHKIRNGFFINVDSHHNQNNWGEINFIKLIKELIRKKNRIFINFSPNNKKKFLGLYNEFKNKKNIIFTYKFTFKKIINAIACSQYVIGNESGPICIAASMKKNIISLYNKKTTKKSSKTIYNKVIFYPNKASEKHILKKIKYS